jgi:Fic family protein
MGHYRTVTDPDVNDGRPYRAYIPSRLQDMRLSLSGKAQTAVDRASREISAVDARIAASSSMPALESLVKSEAIASSYIEGHKISAAQLARGSSDMRSASEDVRAVNGNIEATHRAVRRLGDPGIPISLEEIDRIQADLMETHPSGGARSPHRGLRTAQAILIPPDAIRGEAPRIADATHVPPPASDVRGLMADLIDYMNEPDDYPPLVRAALAHAQFETIHPLPDGNGRTGRALIQAMMRRERLTRSIVLPLSPYFAINSARYVNGLNSVRFDGDHPDMGSVSEWVELFAVCAYSAAANAREVVDKIDALGAQWQERLQQRGARKDSSAYRAIPEILGSIALTVRDLSTRLGVNETTSRTALRNLESIGAVRVSVLGNQTQVFVAEEGANIIADSQRDIAVREMPAGPSYVEIESLPVRVSVEDRSNEQPGGRCGAWMPRSRAHCNLPAGHKGWPTGGHRHTRR